MTGYRSRPLSLQQVLVGGEYTPCRMRDYYRDPFGACRVRPASWISDDGASWRGSGEWPGRIGPRGKPGSKLTATWAVPTGGWDAAQFFSEGDESDDFDPVGPALWHSDNGLAWSRLSAGPARFAPGCGPQPEDFWAVADAGGRRVRQPAVRERKPAVDVAGRSAVHARRPTRCSRGRLAALGPGIHGFGALGVRRRQALRG